MTIACDVDYISVNRCGDGDGIVLMKDVTIPVEGRHVILVDDTVDTGLTLRYAVKELGERAPASLAVCTLLDRPHRRIVDIEIKYRAFEVPDVFVVGYGLDYLGRYRELPALYAHGTWPA
jgi:hypoxanthine phosphoribosyltransferase